MEYVIIGLSFALIVANMWLTERRESRWHKRMDDLLNRKMARDFYDYVNGTEVLNKSKNPQQQLFQDIEQQIRDRNEQGRVKKFVNDGTGVPSNMLGGGTY